MLVTLVTFYSHHKQIHHVTIIYFPYHYQVLHHATRLYLYRLLF